MGLNYINRAVSERLYYSHGYYDVFADIAFSPHVHDVWEIIYFVRGDMSYSVEGRVYTVKSGDVILTRPSAIHMITPNPGTVYERYCALIDFKSIPRQTVKKIPKERDIFKCRGNERIEGLFSKLDDYCRMFQGEELEHLIIGIF